MEEKERLEKARGYYTLGNDKDKQMLADIFPELLESEEERKKRAIAILKQQRDFWSYDGPSEKFPPPTPRKDLVEAIDIALSYLEKQKESLHISEACKENADSFTDEDERIRKEIIDHLVREVGLYPGVDRKEHNWLRWLEKQKEQKPVESTALQKAFISSKFDYMLEEKCDASDYADTILPTSVAYGENEEEYKLHKIIEAAFIAGQKKEHPAEWSEKDEDAYNNALDALYYKDCNDKDDVLSALKCLCDLIADKRKVIPPYQRWKPSKEQMKWLESAVRLSTNKPRIHGIIISLYEQLKRLI